MRSGKAGLKIVALALAVGVGLVFLAKSCGGKAPPATRPVPFPSSAPSTPAAAGTPEAPLVTGNAVLRGRVVFQGEPPPRAQLEVTKDAEACQCAPGDPSKKLPYKLDESLVVDPVSKGVANAVVFLRGVKGGGERLEATVDQRGCVFVPHVALLTPGGRLTILNPDGIAHNYHVSSGPAACNASIAKVKRQITFPPEGSFSEPGFFKASCDVHPWMSMWVAVADNGFCAVTDTEGRFTLVGLAPGDYLSLGVWHETLAKEPRFRSVTVGPEGTEITITLAP